VWGREGRGGGCEGEGGKGGEGGFQLMRALHSAVLALHQLKAPFEYMWYRATSGFGVGCLLLLLIGLLLLMDAAAVAAASSEPAKCLLLHLGSITYHLVC